MLRLTAQASARVTERGPHNPKRKRADGSRAIHGPLFGKNILDLPNVLGSGWRESATGSWRQGGSNGRFVDSKPPDVEIQIASSLVDSDPWVCPTAATGGIIMPIAEGKMGTSCLPFFLTVAAFAQASGQVNVWIPRGPEGGSVGRPVIDPQNPGTLYVAGPVKLLRTTDAADHWSQIGTFFCCTVLAVDPQNSNILYGSGPSKIGRAHV